MKTPPPSGKQYYDSLADLALERGQQRGLGRPLTADEMVDDAVIGPILDKILDGVFGVEEKVS